MNKSHSGTGLVPCLHGFLRWPALAVVTVVALWHGSVAAQVFQSMACGQSSQT